MQGARAVYAEFELGIGDDDAARDCVVGSCRIQRDRRVARLSRDFSAVLAGAIERVGERRAAVALCLFKGNILVVVALFGFGRRRKDGLGEFCRQLQAGRPGLVVGFAAETDNVLENASAKRLRKGCDWIVANDVTPATGIMGGSENAVTLISDEGAESWPRLSKAEVARRLADRIADALTSMEGLA